MDPTATAEIRQRLQTQQIPPQLLEKLTIQVNRLEAAIKSGTFKVEYDRELSYLDFVSSLPFNKSSQDILDLHRASQVLDKNHYGLRPVKDRILEYLSILNLNSRAGKKFHSPVLAFVGLVGSGKTSLAYSIAETLGRKIIRIPFGGLGRVGELRGESRVNAEAEPGWLMKQINMAQVNNPVVLLDEIDRVATESRADIMGVLVELLDPEQNWNFTDHFVDYPFDLSNVLFIATANNLANVATAVLDRMEVIEMPSYTDEEKIIIGKDYLLPKAIEEAALAKGMILIDDPVWAKIVRPLGFDAGIRSLQRNIQTVVRRVARQVVEGNNAPYHVTENNIEEVLSYG